MKNNDWLLGITAIGGILVAGYLYSENKRQMKVIKELVDEREHLKFHFHFKINFSYLIARLSLSHLKIVRKKVQLGVQKKNASSLNKSC